ncbi:MAG TPA: hypothetical protein DEW46_18165 [Verrucomicrobia bacterium]|jgi:uncharacterized protein YjiK|nr:hypothetical protein [Verrucomicrobiota bacterium]
MRIIRLTVLLVFVVGGSACWMSDVDAESALGYDLDSPDKRHVLPAELHEISGLIYTGEGILTCIQDEQGVLFHYDPQTAQVRAQETFGEAGDYEGIARVGDTTYVLRSDGNLFEIQDSESATPDVRFLETGVPGKDNEGLCHDAANNRLLIGTKGNPGLGSESKDLRVVHAFDLASKTLKAEPAFVFDLAEIQRMAEERGLELNPKTSKKGKVTIPKIKLRTSAISVHPVTGKLYMLSADDHLLCVIDPSGRVDHIEVLDPVLFNKAEGITFDAEGKLYVSNEGEDKQPTVLEFSYLQ